MSYERAMDEEITELRTELADLRAENAKIRKALEPFSRFGAYVESHPRNGLDDLLYSWDCLDWGIRKSELIAARAALSPDPERAQPNSE